MEARYLFKQIGRALCRHKARTALTLLGIAIGITAVIAVFSAGEGIKGFVMGQLDIYGPKLIQIEVKVPATKHSSSENAMGQAMGITITTLTMEDAEAIAKIPNISFVTPGLTGQELVSYRGQIKKTMLFGGNEYIGEAMKLKLAEGRFFTLEEDRGLAKVALIGSKVQEKLFGNDDPLNKEIKIARTNYRVIGVLAPQGMGGMMDMDSIVYLPARTLQKSILGIDHVLFIMGEVKDEALAPDTAEEVAWLLRQRHNISDPIRDDFAITTAAQAKEMISTIFDGLTFLLLALVAISLLVGGIGITNVMYVSVTERTFEIGLLKAMGARYADILRQFLLEAVAITLIGGIAGIIIGTILSYFVAWIVATQGFDLPVNVSFKAVAIACGFSIAVGLVFGITPARRAARLEPVEALRKE